MAGLNELRSAAAVSDFILRFSLVVHTADLLK